MRRWVAAAAIMGSLGVAGCDGARQMMGTLGALQDVQHQVAAAIHHENISVNLNNGRYLTVGIVNSPFKGLPPDQKEAKAREIALVAYKAVRSRANLERVGVVFVVRRTYFLFFNYNDATDYHAFGARELTASAPSATPSSR
jgi:hypothetical protein